MVSLQFQNLGELTHTQGVARAVFTGARKPSSNFRFEQFTERTNDTHFLKTTEQNEPHDFQQTNKTRTKGFTASTRLNNLDQTNITNRKRKNTNLFLNNIKTAWLKDRAQSQCILPDVDLFKGKAMFSEQGLLSQSDRSLHLAQTDPKKRAAGKFKAYLKYSPRNQREPSSPCQSYREIINGH